MRILIVEDEEKLERYLKKGLEESSYTVDLRLTVRMDYIWQHMKPMYKTIENLK